MTSMYILFCLLIQSTFSDKRYNVLFVVSDDLRADLGGYYGQNDVIYTPNIDSFQNRAFTFTHAYTQQALCGPTRASFLTGTRPDTTRVWDFSYFRDRMINHSGSTVITMPQYFKDYAKYYTVGSGKVFHPGPASGGDDPDTGCNMGNDMPYSWNSYWPCTQAGNGEVDSSAMHNCPNGTGCVQSESCLNCLSSWGCYIANVSLKTPVVCPADCNDDCFPDADVATKTLQYFAEITNNGNKEPTKPFFIGAGLKRPHMGFWAPLRYYKQYGYNNNYTDISIAKHTTIPINAPIKASNNASGPSGWPDVKPFLYYVNYTDPASGKQKRLRYISTDYHPNLRGGYYASVAFMDAQFGRIIEGLYEYNLWNNTVVVFTGDHGWHLGEQGCWAKFTNFEVATRVPLIIRVPGINEGRKSDLLVEQLDMFPTLIEASNVGYINESNITHQLEGKSLMNIIKNPIYYHDYYAYSQYPRGGKAPDFNIMGISMRTSQWRYTEWLGWYAGTNYTAPYPIWNVSYGVELYNHSNNTIDENDMNGYDNYNLAYNDDMKDIIESLHNELFTTWDNQTWAINHNK